MELKTTFFLIIFHAHYLLEQVGNNCHQSNYHYNYITTHTRHPGKSRAKLFFRLTIRKWLDHEINHNNSVGFVEDPLVGVSASGTLLGTVDDWTVGFAEGPFVGASVGGVVKSAVGPLLGIIDDWVMGFAEGPFVGASVGGVVKSAVGPLLGTAD